jgi:hypothetical protein
MSEEPTIVERPATRGVAPAGAPFWNYNMIDMAGSLETGRAPSTRR